MNQIVLNMKKLFVLPTVLVCLVIANNVEWSVNAVDVSTIVPSLLEIGQHKNSLPNMDDGQQYLKEKCQKNSKLSNSFEKVMEAKYVFENCAKSLVDVAVLQKELEEAKPTGDVDMVFHKYCKKTPLIKECWLNFSSVMNECMEIEERETNKIILNVTEALISFICYDDGDRLALFYAEKGVECVSNNKEGIKHCFNSTLSKYAQSGVPIDMPSDVSNIKINSSNLPSFSFQEDQCKSMNKLQGCVVKLLQGCPDPTPSNIIDSLFNFVRKSSPCSKFKKTV